MGGGQSFCKVIIMPLEYRLIHFRQPELEAALDRWLRANGELDQYTRSSGAKITVVGFVDPSGTVQIEVADQGPGIPKEAQPHLFERYWQPKSSRQSGSGLGLFIVRGVAMAHGGDATLESEVGKGSKFYLRFPSGLEQETGEAQMGAAV